MLVIQKIALQEVFAYDHIRYNTNNIGDRPTDYFAAINANNTKFWIAPNIPRITFTIPQWMYDASYISKQTGKFSSLYAEELDEFVSNFTPQSTPLDGITPYFIRAENVSLKFGQYGKGPYTNLRQILESAMSCIAGHTPICTPDTTPTLTLYFIPWITILPHQEYRAFVYKGHITAISQQNMYSDVWKHIANPDDVLQQHIHTILYHFPTVIQNIVTWTDTFVYDIAILNDTTPHFIEPNTFGAGYASGSSLFEWVADKEILTPNILPPEQVYVRIACDNISTTEN